MKLVVGVTGGIGVGKTTVATMLADRGAVVVDCDALGRQVIERGGRAFDAVVERFGVGILGEDGEIDRAALARIVFEDPGALEDLNAISHPAIDAEIAGHIAEAPDDALVVLDMAVLVESTLGKGQYELVVVVEAALDVRLERLAARGMTRDDALARIKSQATDEERRAVGDLFVRNDGDFSELSTEVDHVWTELVARARRKA